MATEPKISEKLEPLQKTMDDVANEIIAVAKAVKAIQLSPLKRRAIVLLIKDSCSPSISMTDINAVLNACADLAKNYIDPKKL